MFVSGALFVIQFVLDALPSADFPSADPAPYPSRSYLPLPARKKRAAVTASSAGALINSCHGLILDMVNRGHRVLAFAPQLSNNDFRILSHLGAEAYSLPPQLALLDKYRRMRELSTILGDAHPDVVLVESVRNGAVSVAAAKMARVPHVVTIVPSLGPAFMEGAGSSAWPQRQAMKTVYRTIFGWSDAIIFHSEDDRQFVLEKKLAPEKKPLMTVHGWGEDLRRHVQRPLPPLDRGMLFLMATPLDRLQGIIEFCEVAKAMRLKARRARFFLASTPGEAVLPVPTALLRHYREFVQYIGPVDDASPLIGRCHVVVGAVLRQRRAALAFPGLGGGTAHHRHGYAELPRFRSTRIEWISCGGPRRGLPCTGHDPNVAAARPDPKNGQREQGPGCALLRYERCAHRRSGSSRALITCAHATFLRCAESELPNAPSSATLQRAQIESVKTSCDNAQKT